MTLPMPAATFSLMLVEVESVGETNAVVIDSYRRRHVIKLLPRRGAGPLPREGEVWILDKTLGQEWTFAAAFRPNLPVIEGNSGGLSADLAEMLDQMGLITSRITNPATYYLYDDFTGTTIDTDLWSLATASAISQDDRLRIELTSAYPSVTSLRTISEFADKTVHVEVPRLDRDPDGPYHETALSISQDGDNIAKVIVWLDTISDIYILAGTAEVGGVFSTSSDTNRVEYDPDLHRWWRIREEDGTWHYEWSQDGREWEEFWTASSTPLTNAAVALWNGGNTPVNPTPYAEFDNLLVYGPRVHELRFTSSDVFRKADYPGLRAVKVKVQGAGGASGDATTTGAGEASGGGGGGGGGYGESVILVDDLADDEMVTVGSGGSNIAGATGGSGGTSEFGSHITAVGGGGGNTAGPSSGAAVASGGNGADASGADFSVKGQDGKEGWVIGGPLGIGGVGGDSYLGIGGMSGPNISGTGARAGTGYGSGGGGPRLGASRAGQASSSGANGIVIMELIYD